MAKMIIADSMVQLKEFDWIEVPNSKKLVAICSDEQATNLPEGMVTCDRFEHVTNLVSTTHLGQDCIGVYYQQASGHSIEFDVW